MGKLLWPSWYGRLRGLLGVAIGLALAVVPYPRPVAAASAPLTPEQLMVAQVPLDGAADRLTAVDGAADRLTAVAGAADRLTAVAGAADRLTAVAGAGSGLGEIVVSAETSSLTVHWKGQVPAQVNAEIAAIRASGIQVTLQPALHTPVELEAVARRIMSARDRYAGLGIDAVVLRTDGSGLDVAAAGGGAPATGAAAAARSATVAQLASDAGVAVRLVPAMHPQPTSRLLDYVPHWAGARITSDGVHYCTSGFPIVRNSDGRTFILTAGHCAGTPWWSWYGWQSGNNNLKFGDTWTVTRSLNVQYIRSFTGAITYDGGVAVGTEFTKQIVGSTGNHSGDWVCQSGSATGINCAIQLQYQTVVGINGANVTEWEACGTPYQNICRTRAAGAGDSGGPIFSLGSQSGTVIAKGLQSYGFGLGYSCTNNNNETTTCYNSIGFVDIGQILNNYGARIQT